MLDEHIPDKRRPYLFMESFLTCKSLCPHAKTGENTVRGSCLDDGRSRALQKKEKETQSVRLSEEINLRLKKRYSYLDCTMLTSHGKPSQVN